MFGDLMGNMEEQQKQLQEKLAQIQIEDEIQDGAIRVKANANRELVSIHLDPDFLKNAESEELEDLLLVLINRVLEKASDIQTEETQKSLKDMLPPGFDNLLG
jgi:hypothetical protein